MAEDHPCMIREFDGCLCQSAADCQSFAAEQKRKGRDLGTFKKERPAPVVGPTARDTIVVAIAICGVVGSAWGAIHLDRHYKADDLRTQESRVTWLR
ncbi:hypothetical protein GAO09_19540 [Rhizobiales bacterium RZME27]|uniref:Uncharacterized protein n=1 Tax=Endobacterium cereale TaxID=2663029 RepID=A0A6A8AHG8_9HYPH|nr:hypothetical protein [Endobacterium cereale]MQY48231.1 hypothetical protein [Endobacterium cereale]